MGRVIMIHQDVFTACQSQDTKVNKGLSLFKLLYLLEELRPDYLRVLVVGDQLSLKENADRFTESLGRMYTLYPNLFFDFLDSFELRRSYVDYFSKKGMDFSKVAKVTTSKQPLKNNMVLSEKLKERIMKFCEVETVKEMCLHCRGKGIEYSYDQCGCVEHEWSCKACNGEGYLKKLKKRKK